MTIRSWTAISAGTLALMGGLALSVAVFPSAANTPDRETRVKLADEIRIEPAALRRGAVLERPAAVAPASVAKAAMNPAPASHPASIDGIPPKLLDRALSSLDRHRAELSQTARIGIVDYAEHSSKPRFYIVDLDARTATALRVTHGSGSDPDHDGYLDRFSDVDGSNATSRGAYRTAEVYDGKYGRAERLDGLDASNRTARDRAIVIHNAWYAEPGIVASQKKLGRSQGCFAFSAHDLPQVMRALPPGSLIYADKT